MTNKTIDKAKGRFKKAAGELTGNTRLKNEGRVDNAKGRAKQAVHNVHEAFTRRRGTKPRRRGTKP